MLVQVLYSIFLDQPHKFFHQTLVWVDSLCQNATVRREDLVIHAIEGLSQWKIDYLESEGLKVVFAPAFDTKFPHCNKLRMLESEVLAKADMVVMCDCDLAFCAPIDESISAGRLKAKIVDLSNPPIDFWKEIFRAAGFSDSPEIVLTEFSSEPTYKGNFNGGLYIVPKAVFVEIKEPWIRWAKWMIERADMLQQFAVHVDQISFGLAVKELGLDVFPLEPGINFPTHRDLARNAGVDVDARVLHYHDHMDPSGFLLNTNLPRIDEKINKINQQIASRRRKSFDNKVFWEYRYQTAAHLGSGIGSRGSYKDIKRQVIHCFLGQLNRSRILDVGCGDLEVMAGAPASEYTGVDLSESAIELARSKEPDWKFFVGDIRQLDLEPADGILCLDVLIHQRNYRDYMALIERILKLCKSKILISGYNQQPWFNSEITFFHEPMSKTLRRFPEVANLEIVGGYRDISVFAADVVGCTH